MQGLPGGSWWLLRWAVIAFVGTALLQQSGDAVAAPPLIEAPQVRAKARTVTFHSRPALLVESLTVIHAHDVNIRVTCRGCQRHPGPAARKLEPRAGETRFVHVDWILSGGLRVRVSVTAAGAIGRYLILRPAKPLTRDELVPTKKGCLRQGKRVTCPTASSPSEATYRETVGGDTQTWTDYHSAGGLGGPLIHNGETVAVSCAVEGFAVEDGDPWWYRIASSPWNDAYYASADAFYNNGQTSGSLIGTPPVDSQVPLCGT
jgi:hypothetical protein